MASVHALSAQTANSGRARIQNRCVRNRVPWDLQKLWLGHANRDVTDRYAEQLKEDVECRKEVAENTGLGFELPTVESSVGLLGLPSGKKMKVKKAA